MLSFQIENLFDFKTQQSPQQSPVQFPDINAAIQRPEAGDCPITRPAPRYKRGHQGPDRGDCPRRWRSINNFYGGFSKHCGVMPFQNKDCAAMPHGLICNSCFWLPVQVFSAFIAFTTHDACPCFVLASVRAAGCEYRSMQMLVWKNLPQSRAEHADKKAVKPRHNVPKKKHSAILACGPLQC